MCDDIVNTDFCWIPGIESIRILGIGIWILENKTKPTTKVLLQNGEKLKTLNFSGKSPEINKVKKPPENSEFFREKSKNKQSQLKLKNWKLWIFPRQVQKPHQVSFVNTWVLLWALWSRDQLVCFDWFAAISSAIFLCYEQESEGPQNDADWSIDFSLSNLL